MQRIRKFGVALLAAVPLVGGTLIFTHSAQAAGPAGPDTCLYGYVWRDAVPGDHVCVTPAVRTQVTTDNAAHPSHVVPGGGAYGPNTCVQGYVWRDAFAGDEVCVTPATRSQAAADNAAGASHRALDSFSVAGKISDGGDVYGDAQLQLSPDGKYTFKVHLNNANAVARQTSTVCAVKLLNGAALVYQVKGDLNGKLRFWDTSKRDWTRQGTSGEVVSRWATIPRTQDTTCRVSTKIDANQLTGQILEGIATVVAVVVVVA
jgi:hypothetical protein